MSERGRRWKLIGVPYTSMATPGGIAEAIAALRELRLAERLTAVGAVDRGDLELLAPSGERGPSGLLNEVALGRLVQRGAEAVGDARERRLRPLMVGGDCPVLLGALAALGTAGEAVGLVMVDGHEDSWPPERSPTGEGSDCELAIATGRVGGARLPAPLDRLVPLLDPQQVALLGPRDRDELAAAGLPSISDRVGVFIDGAALRRHEASDVARTALASLTAKSLWLHVDLDVLATAEFEAIDYPQPGGIEWSALQTIVEQVLADERVAGASVVIYNPALDPDRSAAAKLIEFLERVVASKPRG